MREYIDKWSVVNRLIDIENEFQRHTTFHGFEYAMYRKICETEIAIGKTPAADVTPVRHGRWVNNIRGDYCKVCSECGFGIPSDAFAWIDCNRESEERESVIHLSDLGVNYCPNCGAKMDLEAPDEA